MAGFHLPFHPVRSALYDPLELLEGFNAQDPHSFAATVDFHIFQYFKAAVKDPAGRYLTGMLEALHDNSMLQGMSAFLDERRCIAIMGGHKVDRASPTYTDVAGLAWNLTRAGYLVATGGGPGVMEAGHLGALMSAGGQDVLGDAIKRLASAPSMPENIRNILDSHGHPKWHIVAEAHAWAKPAIEIFESVHNPGVSLAIPTWLYGHEPFTPFATHIAKFFQNSIREDGLLSIANHGIVYAEGAAGTLQEVFQDANQNFYETLGCFSPMVFLGCEQWAERYPVETILRPLFGDERYDRYVRVTDSVDEAAGFLMSGPPGL